MAEIRLICPGCGAEYRVPETAIPPDGREVECSACGKIWHAEAQALCRVWKLKPDGAPLSDEAGLFVGWQSDFDKRCRAAGWLDVAGVQRQLIALLEAGHFALPETVVFASFDRFTPLENDLMAALSGRGVAVEQVPPACHAESRKTVLHCADRDAECAAVVAWARQRLADDPAARLAIVAPDLGGVRDRLEFLLDDVLHPALIRPDAAEYPRCFNFSLGRALADLGFVAQGWWMRRRSGRGGTLRRRERRGLVLPVGRRRGTR